MRMRRLLAALVLLPALAAASDPPSAGRVPVLQDAQLERWKEKSFEGHTRYRPVEIDGKRVLRAESHGAASGWFREIRVDLTRTPVLHWRWRVAGTLGAIDETSKEGDDYAARIYVIDESAFFWRTRAVNYVWASSRPRGATWPNAFAGDNAQMVAVRSGDAKAGEWVEEARNVREDFRRLFGEDVDGIDAVAIMTDTDNTGRSATAWYGDIWFTGQ